MRQTDKYYCAKRFENSKPEVVWMSNDSYIYRENYLPLFSIEDFYWMSEEPIDEPKIPLKMPKQEINKIKLKPVYGNEYCQHSILENKLEILYQNQEKILQAIKLLYTEIDSLVKNKAWVRK